jgi:hypothetical protein
MAATQDGSGEAPAAPPPFSDDDAPVDLSDIRREDTIVLLLFWILAGVVFL